MREHERAEKTGPPRPTRRSSTPKDHPLLQLQREAGNGAVADLVDVHRHRLDPEEEAGAT